MSIAEDMKALADSSVEKEKNNHTVIARKLFDAVLAQVERSASQGSYKVLYVYSGAHWRLVNEALVPLLAAEGFFANSRDDWVMIRWDDPKKRVENELAVREV